MGNVNRRSKTKVYKDGSSLIDVGLTEAQAIALFGAASVAAWYTIGYMAGGTVGRENDNQKVFDEEGTYVGTTGSRDEHVITNTTQMTDAETLKFFEWMEVNEVPIRYILPTPDPDVVQVHYHPAMLADEGRSFSTSKGVRTMQFTMRGKKSDHVYDDLLADQSDWDAAGLGDAMDTVFAPA